MHAQRLGDPSVATSAIGVGAVRVQQEPGVPGFTGRGIAGAGKSLEVGPLLAGEQDSSLLWGVHPDGLRCQDWV
jgi:hypothetical protein